MCKIGGIDLKGIVDRFEDDRVIIELKDGMIDFDRVLFPDNLKEGDVVEYIDTRFVIREEETKNRKEYIDDYFDSLKEM